MSIESSGFDTVSTIKFLNLSMGGSIIIPIGTLSIFQLLNFVCFFKIWNVALCEVIVEYKVKIPFKTCPHKAIIVKHNTVLNYTSVCHIFFYQPCYC